MLKTAEGTEIRFGQPDHVYRKAKGVSQSELKEVRRSLAHWRARYGPDAEPTFPSMAMIIGTALHAKALEPEAFDGMFVDRSSVDKELTVTQLKAALDDEGIEYKKTAKKPELEALLYPDGKPVDKRTSLSSDDFQIVCGMGDALRAHPVAGQWFDPGRPNYRRGNEVSLYMQDQHESGLPLKGRIDRLEKTENGWLILDLKTTDDASPEAFSKKAFNLGYHIQAAFYSDLVRAVLGGDEITFMFCAIERRRPHGISLYKASDEMVQLGRDEYKSALKSLANALNCGEFPGYPAQPTELMLPRWISSKSTNLPLF
jgi:exodeoxyribonuclease VIII|tara:strand:+ start:493 stop:1437 length:945 start_codon:yes stop_codon:yes gene_type:complete